MRNFIQEIVLLSGLLFSIAAASSAQESSIDYDKRWVGEGAGGKIIVPTNQVLGFDLATADIHFIGASDDADEANTFYLDYSHSDFAVVRGVQDYIRKIGPGLYLGKAFLTLPGAEKRALACFFALDFGQ